jgi:metallophosphoesterase (TIGR00282 family)
MKTVATASKIFLARPLQIFQNSFLVFYIYVIISYNSAMNSTYVPDDKRPVRILCLGDVVGRPGRSLLRQSLPLLRRRLSLDVVIANGENAAGGIGLTPETFRELLAAGVDAVTSGNHIWKHREIRPHLAERAELLRPANYGPAAPGKGITVLPLPGGWSVAVLNLLGRTFMEAVDCPFRAADEALAFLDASHPEARLRIVDFHAEATSEKRAMALHLDGRVSAVCGTHTHVQTADARVSAAGTASITDLGMCGVEDVSVIGMEAAPVLRHFITRLPAAFRPARGEASLNGVIVECDELSGKALSIALLRDKAAEIFDAACMLGDA